MNIEFLKKKRKQESAIANESQINLKKEESDNDSWIDVKLLIDEAFDNFLLGNNIKFSKNLEILENNKYNKYNYKPSK